MKKFIFIYMIYMVVITIAACTPYVNKKGDKQVKVEVYFVDKQMMRLVPTEYYISNKGPLYGCEKILEELTRERKYDSNIRRVIPSEEAVSVKIENEVATVNLQSECFANVEKLKNMENLIVYQIVNSISTVDGVSRVEFTINGEKNKEFFGFIDMRESFVPYYYV